MCNKRKTIKLNFFTCLKVLLKQKRINSIENENYFVKFKTANGPLESKDLVHADLRENIGEIIRENSYLYFTNNQSNVNGIRKIHSKDMVFFTSDKELRTSNRLIGD